MPYEAEHRAYVKEARSHHTLEELYRILAGIDKPFNKLTFTDKGAVATKQHIGNNPSLTDDFREIIRELILEKTNQSE